MRYRLLGRSGLRVSELALGTMTFGPKWGWGASKEESRRIFDAYVAAGGNFVDTANRYTEGTSERFVGEFVAADRERFVLATKYTLFSRRDDPSASGNSRKNMVQSLEASLKRLGTDYVDLFWVHAWDFTTPVEEVMRGLDDLVAAGKVLYVGISDTPAWVVAQANTLADLRGWSRFVGLQIRYSLVDRAAERDLLPMARSLEHRGDALERVGCWRPFRQVWWAFKRDCDRTRGSMGPERTRLGDRRRSDGSSRENRTNTLAGSDQLGPPTARGDHPADRRETAAQLNDNLSCLDFALTADQMEQLSAVSKIELGFPHDFLASNEVLDLVTGGMHGKLDNHRS